MSRTPALYGMTVVRGSTWEDEFIYSDAAGVPIDLTGYEARMQVRTLSGRYGTTESESLGLEISTEGPTPYIVWENAVDGRLVIRCPPEVHATLNPQNAKKATYSYSIELFVPAGADPEYVIPLVKGKLYVHGETTR